MACILIVFRVRPCRRHCFHGDAASFAYDRCATTAFTGPVNGYALGSYTPDLATVTLVSTVVQPAPPPTAVPEPGSVAIMGVALMGFGGLAAKRRRRTL
jgi:hypothetical protein